MPLCAIPTRNYDRNEIHHAIFFFFPQEASLNASRVDLNRLIRTYSHSDGKLKGFGAAAVVRTGPDRREWGKRYRLFCGRGIKNIHVWSFVPDLASGGGAAGGSGGGGGGRGKSGRGGGQWTCLYDTHTNGATVELVAFRNGGLEGISKVRCRPCLLS